MFYIKIKIIIYMHFFIWYIYKIILKYKMTIPKTYWFEQTLF